MFGKKAQQTTTLTIQEEIANLQRKFRLLENEKRQLSEENQAQIRKQRATIEKLTRENRKMKAELNDTRSSTGPQAETKIVLDNLKKLEEQKEKLEIKMATEQEATQGLSNGLATTNQEIFKVRGDMAKNGGINASLDNAKAVQKQIRILENRLDKALQKFNEAIAANRGLREQIDTLRRERVVFDDIYLKLQNELQQKKREMANIIEQANAAYEARDSAQAQMAALKQQADREHAEFEKEWRELGRLIQNDKKMKDFMQARLHDTVAIADKAKDEDRQKKKSTRDLTATIMDSEVSPNQNKITKYEADFARIMHATGIDDLEKLVQKFVESEDQNFTLFKYNHELSTDIEKLEQQITDYRAEHVQLSGTGSRREDTENMKILETLEERFNDTDKKAMGYEVKYQETQTILKNVGEVIKGIFKRLQCKPEDLPSGCGVVITESNLLQYLAVIEGRTAEQLKLWDAVRQAAGEDVSTLDVTRARPGASSATLQVNKLPSTVEDYSDDEDDDDDDDSRPFTVEELKAKTSGKVKKQAQKTKGKGRG